MVTSFHQKFATKLIKPLRQFGLWNGMENKRMLVAANNVASHASGRKMLAEREQKITTKNNKIQHLWVSLCQHL
jgi:hypothetical protein